VLKQAVINILGLLKVRCSVTRLIAGNYAHVLRPRLCCCVDSSYKDLQTLNISPVLAVKQICDDRQCARYVTGTQTWRNIYQNKEQWGLKSKKFFF
jgi:hypothetical protein